MQVPFRSSSFAVTSPEQVGHGVSGGATVLNTLVIRCPFVTRSPDSTFAVPTTGPSNRFVTQIPTPPAASGNGAPKWNSQVASAPPHPTTPPGAVLQCTEESPLQR